MLILKAYVNERKIDEIHVWNTGKRLGMYPDPEIDVYEYRIERPEGYRDIPVYHNRGKGWKDLMLLVLEVLEDA